MAGYSPATVTYLSGRAQAVVQWAYTQGERDGLGPDWITGLAASLYRLDDPKANGQRGHYARLMRAVAASVRAQERGDKRAAGINRIHANRAAAAIYPA